MWECPDFFPLADKHVLLYSTERKVYWEVGTFDKRDLRFHTETRGLLDHGSYYAMKSMVDEKGRRILWGWVQETRSPEECKVAGGPVRWLCHVCCRWGRTTRCAWMSHRSLPRSEPARRNRSRIAPVRSFANSKWGRVLVGSNCVPARRHCLPFNMTAASSVTIGGKTVPLSPDRDGLSSVRLFIDGSIIETFVDSKEVMTARCYTPSPGGIRLRGPERRMCSAAWKYRASRPSPETGLRARS